LALPLPDRLKAVLWMRRSDVACEGGDFDQAESFGQRGYDLAEKHSQADCLGRLAFAKTMSGKLTEAESLFARANDILEGMPGPKTFRQATLESGLPVLDAAGEPMSEHRNSITRWRDCVET
jgi:hypothetical protein